MSQENVDNARRGYAALNEAYRTGDINVFRPTAKELWDPDIVLVTAGVLPDSDTTAHGVDAVLKFVERQMLAFEEKSMWMEPLEFIDAGNYLIVPYRFGGRARHTGIEVEFSFVHVFTFRGAMAVRVEAHPTKADALEAVGSRSRTLTPTPEPAGYCTGDVAGERGGCAAGVRILRPNGRATVGFA